MRKTLKKAEELKAIGYKDLGYYLKTDTFYEGVISKYTDCDLVYRELDADVIEIFVKE